MGKRVSLGKTSQYCSVCYNKEKKLNPETSSKDIKKNCKGTRLGCPGCNNGKGVYVCKICWETYEHTKNT